jgi:hypothetical protein
VRISFVYSTGRTETGVLRMLEGQRRSLIVMCPWRQTPAATFAAVRSQLTPEEEAELAAGLGLNGHRDEQPPLDRPPTNSRS